MFELFRRNLLINNVFLLFLAFGLRAVYFFNPSTQKCVISNSVIDTYVGDFTMMGIKGVLLSGLLIFLNAVMINRIGILYRITKESTAVPGLIYIITSSYFESLTIIGPALLATFILLLIIPILFKVQTDNKIVKQIYTIGLLCGLCQVIYYPSITLTLTVFFTFYSFRSFKTKDNLQFFAGILSVYYLVGVYCFWQDSSFWGSSSYFVDRLGFTTYFSDSVGLKTFAIHVSWIILSVVSLFSFGSFSSKKPNVVQRRISFFYSVMLASLAGLLFHTSPYMPHISIFLLPVSFAISHRLLKMKNQMVPELLVLAATIFSLLVQFDAIPALI